jgi:hypothetical protein
MHYDNKATITGLTGLAQKLSYLAQELAEELEALQRESEPETIIHLD